MLRKTVVMAFVVGCIFFFLTGILFAGDDDVSTPGLMKGAVAPDFTAITHDGSEITLSNVYNNGPVVLIFYRGVWCPFCDLHLQSFAKRLDEFSALGASIIAISVDKPEYAKETVLKNDLGFSIISDSDAHLLEAYNVVYHVPDDLAQKYLKEYKIDLEAYSGRRDHIIAIPATYVIDAAGRIRFSYANTDYKVRAEPEDVLTVLRSLTFDNARSSE